MWQRLHQGVRALLSRHGPEVGFAAGVTLRVLMPDGGLLVDALKDLIVAAGQKGGAWALEDTLQAAAPLGADAERLTQMIEVLEGRMGDVLRAVSSARPLLPEEELEALVARALAQNPDLQAAQESLREIQRTLRGLEESNAEILQAVHHGTDQVEEMKPQVAEVLGYLRGAEEEGVDRADAVRFHQLRGRFCQAFRAEDRVSAGRRLAELESIAPRSATVGVLRAARLQGTRAWTAGLDFGGSGTRLAVWQGSALVRFERWTGPEHASLWSGPGAARRVVERLGASAEKLAALGVSFSGDISPGGEVVNSDRLADISGARTLPLQPALQRHLPHAVVRVLNDADAGALGWVGDCLTPFLVLTLGTWPSIRVVDRDAGGVLLYRPPWLGALELERALCDAELRRDGAARRSERVGEALAALLSCYLETYQWKPTAVLVTGGHAVGLDPAKTRGAAAARLPANYLSALPADLSPEIRIAQSPLEAALPPLLGARRVAAGLPLR